MKEWSTIYYGINTSKHYGIYLLSHGHEIADVLESVYDNFAEHLSSVDLIPVCFSSPHQLMMYLTNYRHYCQQQKKWMLKLPRTILDNNEVYDVLKMVDDVIEMATYCIDSYEVSTTDDIYDRPYVRMKECLLHEDIDSFISEINIVLNEIPFSIYKYKESEGRYHSIIHAILFQLGFHVLSEKATNLGRLDMLVELEKYVYVFEFKYSNSGEKLSHKAIEQIKEKKYALSYLNTSRKVYAVGVTVGGEGKNAYDWDVERLN